MAATEYLDGACGPLTRAIGKVLVSVGLVSPDGSAPYGGVTMENFLKESRLNLLPFTLIWNAPRSVRMLATRQYVLLVAIRLGLFAGRFIELFGMVWGSMHVMNAMYPGSFDLIHLGPDRLMEIIAISGLKLFGAIGLLCWTFTLSCYWQPKHLTQAEG